ncbi:hypothetical protein, partial [Neisseria meningitidis]
PSESVPYYLYCLRLRRLVLIFVNPLYCTGSKCRLKLFVEEIYPVWAVAPNASVRFEKCRLKRKCSDGI